MVDGIELMVDGHRGCAICTLRVFLVKRCREGSEKKGLFGGFSQNFTVSLPFLYQFLQFFRAVNFCLRMPGLRRWSDQCSPGAFIRHPLGPMSNRQNAIVSQFFLSWAAFCAKARRVALLEPVISHLNWIPPRRRSVQSPIWV